MNCPACQAVRLRERSIVGVALDECGSCGGIWFDRDELAQYRSKLSSERPAAVRDFIAVEGQKARPCPRCRVLTLKYGSLGELRLHHCRNCKGIFLPRSAVASLGKIRPVEHVTAPAALIFDESDLFLEILIEAVGTLLDW